MGTHTLLGDLLISFDRSCAIAPLSVASVHITLQRENAYKRVLSPDYNQLTSTTP